MKYEIDIKITNLVRGKWLCEQIISSQETIEEVALVIENVEPIGDEILNDWIHEMITFLLGVGYP